MGVGINFDDAMKIADPHTPFGLADAVAPKPAMPESPAGDYTMPGGSPSAAGRSVQPVKEAGAVRYESYPGQPGLNEHLAGGDIRVPTTDKGFASTRGAEAAASYLKGSKNYESPLDNPNSVIPPETKIQAAVDPGVRALETSYGLNKGKKGPKI